MSTPQPSTTTPTEPPQTQNVTTSTDYTLTVTNNSTVPGQRYFNIFPLPLKSVPIQNQYITARVSPPTRQHEASIPINWQSDQTTMTILAVSTHDDINQAVKLAAPLGSTVTLDWQDGAYLLTQSASATGTAVTVNVTADVPANSLVGLSSGLAPILVDTTGAGALSLEPDLSPGAIVKFGTAYQWASSDVSDDSKSLQVTFYPNGENKAYAQIQIGLDNLISQIG